MLWNILMWTYYRGCFILGIRAYYSQFLYISLYYTLKYFVLKKGPLAPVRIRSWETSTIVKPAGGIYSVLPLWPFIWQGSELNLDFFSSVIVGWWVLQTGWTFLVVLGASVLDQHDFVLVFMSYREMHIALRGLYLEVNNRTHYGFLNCVPPFHNSNVRNKRNGKILLCYCIYLLSTCLLTAFALNFVMNEL